MPFGHQDQEAGRLGTFGRGTPAGCGGDAGPGPGAWRRPGVTGHCSRTQARNPARVETGARARRSSHKTSPPATASGVRLLGGQGTVQVLRAGAPRPARPR